MEAKHETTKGFHNMKTVYTVLNSRAELVGVYSSMEKAQEAKLKHQDGGYQCRIIAVELDA